MKMNHISICGYPASSLYEEETLVIIATVIDQISGKNNAVVDDGTFALYELKDDKTKPNEVITINFGDGPTFNFHFTGKDSAELARDLLGKSSNSPKRKDGQIIEDGENPPYLSISTDFGRYTCAFFAGNGCPISMSRIYIAVAEALSKMRPNDSALQKYCDVLFTTQMVEDRKILEVRRRVDDLFKSKEITAFSTWEKWHDANIATLKSYFAE